MTKAPADVQHYDLVVIGAGSGGLTAAAGAAGLGLRVALIEGRERLGGDCALFGCVPSKTLLHAAKVAHQTRHTLAFGLPPASMGPVQLGNVMSHVQETISHFTNGTDSTARYAGLGVDVFLGQQATFVGPRRVRVGEHVVQGKVVFIATGSRPAVPPIAGIDTVPYLTNERLYSQEWDQLPKTMVVAGGGPIGVETAQAFHRLGSRVVLVEPLDCILSREDHEVACWLRAHLVETGIDIRVNSRVEAVRQEGGKIVVTISTKEDARHPEKPQAAPIGRAEVSADAFFVATGRKPNVEGLGLEQAGVTYSRTGITVDSRLRTSAKGVFAIGDVTGGLNFTHVAEAQARLALRNAFFPFSSKWSDSLVPWATFSDPELARVGLTEQQAREGEKDVVVHRFKFEHVDRAVTDGQAIGLVKVVATRRGTILGAHVVGPGAGEMIHEFVLAMHYGLTLGDIARTIHVYPTLALAVRRAADQHYKVLFEKNQRVVHRIMRLAGFRPSVRLAPGLKFQPRIS